MKDHPGKFRLNVTYTATDPTTGAMDSVSRVLQVEALEPALPIGVVMLSRTTRVGVALICAAGLLASGRRGLRHGEGARAPGRA